MNIKFKKLDEKAATPYYAKEGDAGLDLTAVSINETIKYIEYGTGISIEIPEGYVGLLFPRSSITTQGLLLKNSVGVIDSGYRGEIKLRFHSLNSPFDFFTSIGSSYKIGDRIAQLIILPYPKINLIEATELSETTRGTGGYGSTGK